MAKYEMSDLDDAIKGPAVGMRGLGHISVKAEISPFSEVAQASLEAANREFRTVPITQADADGRKALLDSSDATGL